MRRFVALLWSAERGHPDAAHALRARLEARAPGWRMLVDVPGLLVFATAERSGATRVYPLPGDVSASGAGVVLGNLFERGYVERFTLGDGAPAEVAFTARESRAVVRDGGRRLLGNYWGRYLAFLYDAERATVSVVRDPGGALPCYFLDHAGLGVYAAEIDDLGGLGLPALAAAAVDWSYVGRYLHFESNQNARTGLLGVSRLLPGQRREHGPRGAALTQPWDPVVVARSHVVDDVDEASDYLRRTAAACMAAWASQFQHLVHRLSGGLDSAIILGCLAKAPQRGALTALHYTTALADGDERTHARRAADYAGVAMREEPARHAELSDEALASMPRTASPMNYHYGLSAAGFEARLAQRLGADGFTSGHGGDEVLAAIAHPLGIVDFLQRRGLDPALPRFAMDAALLSRRSLWSVLAVALRRAILRRPCDLRALLEVPPSRALAPSVREALRVEDIEHPSLAGAALPPGKWLHVFATQTPHIDATLAAPQHWLDQVHPFHSQPLLELCLRVPSYVLAIDGRNRGLARLAFSGLVAPEILARKAKGSGDLHHDEGARALLGLARNRLVNGALVAHGLLDPDVLVHMFDNETAALRPYMFTYLCVEHWVQSWSQKLRSP